MADLNIGSIRSQQDNHIPFTENNPPNDHVDVNYHLIEEEISNDHVTRQQSWKPQAVILGPGGLKGFIELGALYYLNTVNFFDGVTNYIGVSIGSIIWVLHLCGLSFVEISNVGMNIDLFSLFDMKYLPNMLEGKGLVDCAEMRTILTEAIRSKRDNVPSFSELYKETAKELIIVSYNLTRKTTMYFSRVTHPDMSIVEAAIASGSIPFVFYQYNYRNETYIDGAFGNPYPIDVADDGRNNILGIYIHNKDRVDTKNWMKYGSAIIHAPITELRKSIIKNCSSRCRHLLLENTLDDSTGMDVDLERRRAMFRTGYQTAHRFYIQINHIS